MYYGIHCTMSSQMDNENNTIVVVVVIIYVVFYLVLHKTVPRTYLLLMVSGIE